LPDKKSSYQTPSNTAYSEQLISKSRFIASVAHAVDKDGAMGFIKKVKQAHSGAHHNTFAFIIGSLEGSSETGYSDDGEVSGCAGKPILSILQHKAIGDVAAVVTRYYGGTKLGTGGLVRAYSGTLMLALNKLELRQHVSLITVSVTFPYQYESPLRGLFEKHGIGFNEPVYTDVVSVHADFPEDNADNLKSEIMNLTRGQARIETIDS
jgi:uncharacterized YigZ family protein